MKGKKTLCFIGIAAIVLGIICLCMSTGSYEIGYTYGGDAYTGIQQAAAQTANNVQSLAKIVKTGFGSVLIIGGAALFVVGSDLGGAGFSISINKKKKEEAPTETVATEKVKCPNCGEMLDAGVAFCTSCGAKMVPDLPVL